VVEVAVFGSKVSTSELSLSSELHVLESERRNGCPFKSEGLLKPSNRTPWERDGESEGLQQIGAVQRISGLRALLVLRGELGFEPNSLWKESPSFGLFKPLAELGEEGKKGAD